VSGCAPSCAPEPHESGKLAAREVAVRGRGIRDEVLHLLSERDSMDSAFLAPHAMQALLDRAAKILASGWASGYQGQLLADHYFV